MIRLANESEIQKVSELADIVKAHMLESGIRQWTGTYPEYEVFKRDYKNKALYAYCESGKIIASITIMPENEKAYEEIKWLKEKSLVIHRIIVHPDYQKQGIGRSLFTFAKDLGNKDNYESIKVDTHPDNFKMHGLIDKMGYEKIGYLSSINRLAYELVL